ncbi:MAG TPA: hypothetical protein VFE07_06005 [Marmoricola sp.]|nr:hypothetical protein [Marmoricola sp.]
MRRTTSTISALLLIGGAGVLVAAPPTAASTIAVITSTETFTTPQGFADAQPVEGSHAAGVMLVNLFRNGSNQAAMLDTHSRQYTLIAPGSLASRATGISADGGTVTYIVDGPSSTHVFARDLSSGATRQVDVDESGTPVDSRCYQSGPGSLTPDGRFVAFLCGAGRPYVRDLQTGRLAAGPASLDVPFGYALLDGGDRLLFTSPGTATAPDFSYATDGFVYAWTPSTGAVSPVVDCTAAACYFNGASGDGHLISYTTSVGTLDTAHVRNLTTNKRWTTRLSQKGWAASVAHDGAGVVVWEGTDGVHPSGIFVGDPDHGFAALSGSDGVPSGEIPTWIDDDATTIWTTSDQDAGAWHIRLTHDESFPPIT